MLAELSTSHRHEHRALPQLTGRRVRRASPGWRGTDEIGQRGMVKEAPRLRPSRIIAGKVRAEERLGLLTRSTPARLPSLPPTAPARHRVKTCTLPLLAGDSMGIECIHGLAPDWADA